MFFGQVCCRLIAFNTRTHLGGSFKRVTHVTTLRRRLCQRRRHAASGSRGVELKGTRGVNFRVPTLKK